MTENILATLLFWAAFAYSPGPFWAAIMQYAATHSFKKIYKNYIVYFCSGWLSLCVTITLLTHYLSQILTPLILMIHLFGPLFILYIAYKVYRSNVRLQDGASFDFNWKNMALLSWSNPKCWILVPIGAVNAQFTEIALLDAILYTLIGLPLFLSGIAFWGNLGRLGAKVSIRAISYFNIFLLLAFALLLEYEGWLLLQKSDEFSLF